MRDVSLLAGVEEVGGVLVIEGVARSLRVYRKGRVLAPLTPRKVELFCLYWQGDVSPV